MATERGLIEAHFKVDQEARRVAKTLDNVAPPAGQGQINIKPSGRFNKA